MTCETLECYANNLLFNLVTYTTDRGEKAGSRKRQRERERFGENR